MQGPKRDTPPEDVAYNVHPIRVNEFIVRIGDKPISKVFPTGEQARVYMNECIAQKRTDVEKHADILEFGERIDRIHSWIVGDFAEWTNQLPKSELLNWAHRLAETICRYQGIDQKRAADAPQSDADGNEAEKSADLLKSRIKSRNFVGRIKRIQTMIENAFEKWANLVPKSELQKEAHRLAKLIRYIEETI